jgi:hypothetical protein
MGNFIGSATLLTNYAIPTTAMRRSIRRFDCWRVHHDAANAMETLWRRRERRFGEPALPSRVDAFAQAAGGFLRPPRGVGLFDAPLTGIIAPVGVPKGKRRQVAVATARLRDGLVECFNCRRTVRFPEDATIDDDGQALCIRGGDCLEAKLRLDPRDGADRSIRLRECT